MAVDACGPPQDRIGEVPSVQHAAAGRRKLSGLAANYRKNRGIANVCQLVSIRTNQQGEYMRKMSAIDWALRPLKNYADFSGRASRAEFWWFFLFMMLFYVVVWAVFFATVGMSASSGTQPSFARVGIFGVFGIGVILSYLVLLIPMIAVQVRRIHDTNRSGWWLGAFWILYVAYLFVMFSGVFSTISPGSPPNIYSAGAIGILGLAMFVYSIVLLVFWCIPGTRGANRFGEDPYGADVEEVFA